MDLNVHHDKIIGSMGRWKRDEAARASDAGETREEIGSLLELTGLNKKAFSWARALDKLESDKRNDVLRSFDALRELLDKHWNGQSTPDMFDDADDEPAAPVTEDDLSFLSADPDHDPGDYNADDDTFDAAVDGLNDDNVVPFGAAEVA